MDKVVRLILVSFLIGVTSIDFPLYSSDFPFQIRMIRAFGADDEKEPPILIFDSPGSKLQMDIGSSFITIEFDINSRVPPNLYLKFIHCSADWKENENVFLNDVIYSRTTNIDWYSAPVSSSYYTYRGRVKVPNMQVQFKFAGNWKAKVFDYYNDSVPIAETRFFVVKPKAKTDLRLYTDFYDPKYNFISPSSVTLESIVYTDQKLFDGQLNTVVFYRNHRWFEPFYVSTDASITALNQKSKYYYPTMVGGFSSAGKMFRIERIPAENEYRILNLSNLTSYPEINNVVRSHLSDYRRRGDYFDADDDGAMITRFVSDYNDYYVNMEFKMDPDGWISGDEVYVVGSFNNWKPDAGWQMYYDEDERYYKLRQLVRRARHNYLYATGKMNITTGKIEKLSFDEYEGNTSSNSHTYISFVYYREFDYGGYDALISVAAASTSGTFRRF